MLIFDSSVSHRISLGVFLFHIIKHKVKLAAWEEYAFQMKQKSSNGSPRQNLYSMLEIWYVALRMVVQSWEEEEQLVLQWLNIKNGFPNEGWFRYHLTDS